MFNRPAMFCPVFTRRIPAAPDFGPLQGDLAFEQLWALKRAFLDMAAYGVYDLLLLQQPLETLASLLFSGHMTPDEQRRVIIALKQLGDYLGVPLPVPAMETLARSGGEVTLTADTESAENACADEAGVDSRASLCGGPAPLDDTRRAGDASAANDGAEPRNGEPNTALDDALSGVTAGDSDNLATEVQTSRDDDAAAVKKRKKNRKKRDKKKKGHDEQRGAVGAMENKAIMDDAIVEDAAGDCQDGEEEVRESQHCEEHVGQSQCGHKEAGESRDGDAAAAEEGKDEGNAGDDDSAGNWEGVANCHVVDKEDEIAQLGDVSGETAANTKHDPKENVKMDCGEEEERQEENEIGSKMDESEDEEEEAASAEVAPTAAANEDAADSKEHKSDEEEANHDGDASKARQADSEDADTDHKEEPDVNNRKEEETTDSGSKATATTTADPKVDAESPVATDNARALVTWWTNRAGVWSCVPRVVRRGQG